MHISVIFPTHMAGCFKKHPQIWILIENFANAQAAMRGFTKPLHSASYTHMHISVFFPTNEGLLYKTPIQKGLFEAPRGFEVLQKAS